MLIRSRAAIHANVIVVSRRNRTAIATLATSPLRWAARASGFQRPLANPAERIRGGESYQRLQTKPRISKVCTTRSQLAEVVMAVIFGGGWAGNSSFKLRNSISSSASGWVSDEPVQRPWRIHGHQRVQQNATRTVFPSPDALRNRPRSAAGATSLSRQLRAERLPHLRRRPLTNSWASSLAP